jgi:hypothetical protein
MTPYEATCAALLADICQHPADIGRAFATRERYHEA